MSDGRKYSGLRPLICFDEKCDCIQNTITGEWKLGKSFVCWGAIELVDLTIHGENHPNDISHCVYTPGKGLIRYYENRGDQEIALRMAGRLLRKLGYKQLNLKWLFGEEKDNMFVSPEMMLHFDIEDKKEKEW